MIGRQAGRQVDECMTYVGQTNESLVWYTVLILGNKVEIVYKYSVVYITNDSIPFHSISFHYVQFYPRRPYQLYRTIQWKNQVFMRHFRCSTPSCSSVFHKSILRIIWVHIFMDNETHCGRSSWYYVGHLIQRCETRYRHTGNHRYWLISRS